jgi:hypothetical protein
MNECVEITQRESERESECLVVEKGSQRISFISPLMRAIRTAKEKKTMDVYR